MGNRRKKSSPEPMKDILGRVLKDKGLLDLDRIVKGMGEKNADSLGGHLSDTRQRVSERFEAIFPSQPVQNKESGWGSEWHSLQNDRQGNAPAK